MEYTIIGTVRNKSTYLGLPVAVTFDVRILAAISEVKVLDRTQSVLFGAEEAKAVSDKFQAPDSPLDQYGAVTIVVTPPGQTQAIAVAGKYFTLPGLKPAIFDVTFGYLGLSATAVRVGDTIRFSVSVQNRSVDPNGFPATLPAYFYGGVKYRQYVGQVFGQWDKQFIAPANVPTPYNLPPGDTVVQFEVSTYGFQTGVQVEDWRDYGNKDIYIWVSLLVPEGWGPTPITGDMTPGRDYQDAFYVGK